MVLQYLPWLNTSMFITRSLTTEVHGIKTLESDSHIVWVYHPAFTWTTCQLGPCAFSVLLTYLLPNRTIFPILWIESKLSKQQVFLLFQRYALLLMESFFLHSRCSKRNFETQLSNRKCFSFWQTYTSPSKPLDCPKLFWILRRFELTRARMTDQKVSLQTDVVIYYLWSAPRSTKALSQWIIQNTTLLTADPCNIRQNGIK